MGLTRVPFHFYFLWVKCFAATIGRSSPFSTMCESISTFSNLTIPFAVDSRKTYVSSTTELILLDFVLLTSLRSSTGVVREMFAFVSTCHSRDFLPLWFGDISKMLLSVYCRLFLSLHFLQDNLPISQFRLASSFRKSS